jgi:cytochrome c oxidase subunit IV
LITWSLLAVVVAVRIPALTMVGVVVLAVSEQVQGYL